MGEPYLPKEIVSQDKQSESYIKGSGVKIVSVPHSMDNVRVHSLDKALDYLGPGAAGKVSELIKTAEAIESYLRGEKDEADDNLDNPGDEAERAAAENA